MKSGPVFLWEAVKFGHTLLLGTVKFGQTLIWGAVKFGHTLLLGTVKFGQTLPSPIGDSKIWADTPVGTLKGHSLCGLHQIKMVC